MQETLRKAEDVRWAKEGEVTILRKGIQKVRFCLCYPALLSTTHRRPHKSTLQR